MIVANKTQRSRSGRVHAHRTWIVEPLENRILLADGINPLGGANINGMPGIAITGDVVATYTIADSSGDPGSKWRAKVDWGDGSVSDKNVSPTSPVDGVYSFADSHTYASAGNFTVTVQIAVPGSGTPNDNTVTFSAIIAAAPTLQSITVAPTTPGVAKGETESFTATGNLSDGSTEDLTTRATWTSESTSVATISNTAGTNGVATAVSQGTSTISASMGGVSGSTVLTVTNPVLLSILVTPANSRLPLGETQQFHATGVLSDASTEDLTNLVAWASAGPTVATISNASGSLGLAASVGEGSTEILASYQVTSGSTTLTVAPPVLVSVAVTPANPSVGSGQTTQFIATGTRSDRSTEDLTSLVSWSSSSTAVASISATGLATGHSAGTSTINATVDGITGTATILVPDSALPLVTVTRIVPVLNKKYQVEEIDVFLSRRSMPLWLGTRWPTRSKRPARRIRSPPRMPGRSRSSRPGTSRGKRGDHHPEDSLRSLEGRPAHN